MRISSDYQTRGLFRGSCLGPTVAGYRARAQPEPGTPHKTFSLPSTLDMGLLKLEDLEFDIDQEVARLRAEDSAGSEIQPLDPHRDAIRSH